MAIWMGRTIAAITSPVTLSSSLSVRQRFWCARGSVVVDSRWIITPITLVDVSLKYQNQCVKSISLSTNSLTISAIRMIISMLEKTVWMMMSVTKLVWTRKHISASDTVGQWLTSLLHPAILLPHWASLFWGRCLNWSSSTATCLRMSTQHP